MDSLENLVIILKIKNYLPEFKFTPLYDGLKETIEWFEQNYENVRGKKSIHSNQI